ncbi:putative secreted protein (Por secretion system target) [Nonlabens dokdonensis]|uniref:Carboxypeptidase T n=2 Tax=Nonlabens dokdonensis TaxID=328515 RepID=L7WHL9_NONDD|nr:T9SS type A sorting domain-containing protein [Nonlabens dokdonensis]AGC78488.1 carboxypeptidase T [Nonlabens dokdonensis DSW-6]PZX38232.1 putative secreted protein (Por secretion system target) [Nonlabens dokdonensis]
MKKTYSFLLLFCAILVAQAQVTYTANGGSSFGGPIGNSSMVIDHDATNITISVDRGGDLGSNNMVMYIDTGAAGRTAIDGNVNDDGDLGRKAVSKFGGGDLNFPPGFEVSHAIYGDAGFMGLFQIPATGVVGTNNLNFLTGVGNGSADPFVLTVSWAQLGLTSTDTFSFVVTYGNPNDFSGNMFTSNEGYGDGILNGGNNIAFDAMTYTTYFEYPSGDKHGIARNQDSAPLPDAWSFDYSWVNGNPPNSTDEIIIETNITMNTDVTVDNSLTVNAGTVGVVSTAVFTLNGTLTIMPTMNPFAPIEFGLDSDANGSAQFINGPMATINGDVGVARFIPTGSTSNRRAFRFIASPVTTTTTIFENWQTNGLNIAGIGTHITGSTTGTNGFDATQSGANSLIFYDIDPMDGNYKWQESAGTNLPTATLTAGQPFNIFVRGDRNYDLTTAPELPNADVRIPTKGALELGQTVNSGALNPNAGGFSFVGNPYQATVNMSTVTKNNINPNFVYIWNPNGATRGVYETVDMAPTSTDARRYIQPGQSFFVLTSAAGPASLDFNATDKATTQNAVGPFSTPQNRPYIDVSLYKDLNGSSVIFDNTKIFLDGDNTIDANDALKIENFEENLSVNQNGTLLSIENKAMPTHNEIIALEFTDISSSTYDVEINVEGLASNLEAFVHDSFLNADTLLSSGNNTLVWNFDLNNSASIDPSRFEIRFNNVTLSTAQTEGLEFSMFPNPSNQSVITITGDFIQNITTAVFYNTLGQEVLKADLDSNESMVNVSNLDAGIYLVNITSGKDSVTKKLVIK